MFEIRAQACAATQQHHKQTGVGVYYISLPHVLFLLRRGHLHAEDDEDSGDRPQEPAGDGDGLVTAARRVFVLQLLHQRAQQSVDELAGEERER